MNAQKQTDPFSRCFPVKGSAQVVCEHENGSYVIGANDEEMPENKKRLKLLL